MTLLTKRPVEEITFLTKKAVDEMTHYRLVIIQKYCLEYWSSDTCYLLLGQFKVWIHEKVNE